MKIAILGFGKMGQTITRLVSSDNDNLRSKAYEIWHIEDPGKAHPLDDKKLSEADVAIEFTKPNQAEQNIMRCFRLKVPVVCGTTGWDDGMERVELECAKGKHSFFYAPNFSLGVNIFFAVNEYLARLMDNYPEYHVSMRETHHTEKLDAPSGTAIRLANGIIQNSTNKSKWVKGLCTDADKVGIESIREPGVPGTHEISYKSGVDQIDMKHEAYSREGFAYGALRAAEWLPGKKGCFGMKDLLGIN